MSETGAGSDVVGMRCKAGNCRVLLFISLLEPSTALKVFLLALSGKNAKMEATY